MLVESFFLLLLLLVLVAAIVHTVQGVVAWSVVVHCVKTVTRRPFFS